jgi:hypothetical protein
MSSAADPAMRCNAQRRLQSTVMALFVACPSAIRAQATPGVASTPRSGACIEHIPPSAFTRVVVYATLDVPDSVSRPFAATADSFLQEIVIAAQKLLGARGDTLPEAEPTIDWRGLEGRLHLNAFRDGRIIASETPPPAAAAALMARALKESGTPALLDWTAEPTRDSISFDVEFVRPLLDSAGHVFNPSVKRAALALFSVRTPWERQVSPKRGGPRPRYPEEARAAGYEGNILLQFIVDSMGRAVDSTVKDLWPSGTPRLTGEKLSMYESFLESTKRAVRRMDFVPAIMGGCRVNQLVQMPFVFGLNRRD